MGNATLEVQGVPFQSSKYHVLLYGLNEVGPKLDDLMSNQNTNLIPLLLDEDEHFPGVFLRRVDPVNRSPASLEKFINKNSTLQSSELSNLFRFIDQNTLQPHYELFVSNQKNYHPSIILFSINVVVHMLRIRGFKFITPLILSAPYFQYFETPEVVKIANYEDIGLSNLDTQNVILTLDDIEWVTDNIYWFIIQKLDSRTEFDLPLEMLYASIFSSSERAKLASLWIGIESLIKTKDEKIGQTVISSLKKFGGISGNKAKNYWGDSIGRCRVVHGVVSKSKTEADLRERVDDVREVFCKMLQYFLEGKISPTEENVFAILNLDLEREASVVRIWITNKIDKKITVGMKESIEGFLSIAIQNGCIRSTFAEDEERIIVYTRWADEMTLEQFRSSEDYKTKEAIIIQSFIAAGFEIPDDILFNSTAKILFSN